jgi:hypothetical protein
MRFETLLFSLTLACCLADDFPMIIPIGLVNAVIDVVRSSPYFAPSLSSSRRWWGSFLPFRASQTVGSTVENAC